VQSEFDTLCRSLEDQQGRITAEQEQFGQMMQQVFPFMFLVQPVVHLLS